MKYWKQTAAKLIIFSTITLNLLAGDLLEKLEGEGYLLFIGQDNDTIDSYHESNKFPAAAGVVLYTNPFNLDGIVAPADYGAGRVDFNELKDKYPNQSLMIGLSLSDNEEVSNGLERITSGEFDANFKELGVFIRDYKQPVLVRIGYEFDGPWYGYSREHYKAAYRYIVELLRPIAPNFVNVWHGVAFPASPEIMEKEEKSYKDYIRDWYPGSEWVDWVGISWFNPIYEPYAQDFADLSREHQKPLMMAETAPMSFDLEKGTQGAPVNTNKLKAGETIQSNLSGEDIWNAWFKPLLAFMERNNDVVHSICYINTDWDSQPMWSPDTESGNYQSLYWGDSRIQANPELSILWQELLERPEWITLHNFDPDTWMVNTRVKNPHP